MSHRARESILCCSDCGSRLVELHGQVKEQAVIRCAECGTEAGRWPEFLMEIASRIEQRQQERRRRRLH